MLTLARNETEARWPPKDIAALRKRLGVTQAVMADWLGYSVARSVSDLENGHKRPSSAVYVLLDLIDEFDGLPSKS